MMGRQTRDQSQLFYLLNLDERIQARHLLRRINPIVTLVLGDLREKLKPFYSEIGRPSIDPELMLRMLIVGYCYCIRFERKLCEDVELHLAYRWFCRLDFDNKLRDHSKFSVIHGFRKSALTRRLLFVQSRGSTGMCPQEAAGCLAIGGKRRWARCSTMCKRCAAALSRSQRSALH